MKKLSFVIFIAVFLVLTWLPILFLSSCVSIDDSKNNKEEEPYNCISHVLDDNCTCINCNKSFHDMCRHNEYVYFGAYPQSIVVDSELKSDLTNMIEVLPNYNNSGKWTSYEYYRSGEITDYMWYIDVEYAKERYRGVYFTSYRTLNINIHSDFEKNSVLPTYGYRINTIYWFKYEPIKWRILIENNGQALLLSQNILDSREYFPYDTLRYTNDGDIIYPNNWEHSTIRSWLNSDFYNTSFDNVQKKLIVPTMLDNSTTAYNSKNNKYATSQNQTVDKIFLLSYKDVLNECYGFNPDSAIKDSMKLKQVTDYAKVQGAYDIIYGWWLLRSAHPYGGISFVTSANEIEDVKETPLSYFEVEYTIFGIAPALMVNLL